MDIISEKAIILKKYPLYDFDEILVLFGAEYGVFKGTASKSKKSNSIFFGKTELFTLGIFKVKFSGYEALSRIKDIQILNRFQVEEKGVQNFYLLSFFSELILKSIFEKNSFNRKIFNLFERLINIEELDFLGKQKISLYVIFWIMKIEGLIPIFNRCFICGREIKREILLQKDILPICDNCGRGKSYDKKFFNNFYLPPEKFLITQISEKDIIYFLKILISKFENFINRELNTKKLLFN